MHERRREGENVAGSLRHLCGDYRLSRILSNRNFLSLRRPLGRDYLGNWLLPIQHLDGAKQLRASRPKLNGF